MNKGIITTGQKVTRATVKVGNVIITMYNFANSLQTGCLISLVVASAAANRCDLDAIPKCGINYWGM